MLAGKSTLICDLVHLISNLSFYDSMYYISKDD